MADCPKCGGTGQVKERSAPVGYVVATGPAKSRRYAVGSKYRWTSSRRKAFRFEGDRRGRDWAREHAEAMTEHTRVRCYVVRLFRSSPPSSEEKP